jgi:hypothetical protein
VALLAAASDYLDAGGFDLTINGWGKEDKLLLEAVLKHGGIEVTRSVDKSIVHMWHEKLCSPDLKPDQLKDCRQSMVEQEGTKQQLVRTRMLNKLSPTCAFWFSTVSCGFRETGSSSSWVPNGPQASPTWATSTPMSPHWRLSHELHPEC